MDRIRVEMATRGNRRLRCAGLRVLSGDRSLSASDIRATWLHCFTADVLKCRAQRGRLGARVVTASVLEGSVAGRGAELEGRGGYGIGVRDKSGIVIMGGWGWIGSGWGWVGFIPRALTPTVTQWAMCVGVVQLSAVSSLAVVVVMPMSLVVVLGLVAAVASLPLEIMVVSLEGAMIMLEAAVTAWSLEVMVVTPWV